MSIYTLPQSRVADWDLVYRFIKVANETMCRPLRALTEARGYATGKHVYAPRFVCSPSCLLMRKWVFRLASFGGAGGQHACEIARLLGINSILIHRYSSILSAYGLALADRPGQLLCVIMELKASNDAADLSGADKRA